jgi:Zn-dependent protease/CBS domain-containing protein
MKETLPLGKVAGIRIGANWSLLLIFGLIVVSLAESQLPHSAPGHLAMAYTLAAVVVAVVFYACLVCHELAHALVARRHKLEVEGIVLWLLGGVSKLKGDAVEPGTELRVAVAGPATSMALALAFFSLSVLAASGHSASLLAAGLGWLGWINGALALFNLIPAFPLDGGRILRSLLWRRYADKDRATHVCTRVSQVVGYGFIGLGVLGALVTSLGLSGLWLALIGWFLLTASRSQAESSIRASELAGLRVADAMVPDYFSVPAWATLDRVWDEAVYRRRLEAFPIVGADGFFYGLASAARIRRVPADRWAHVTVDRVARPATQCVLADPEESLVTVANRMAASPERRAVVLYAGRPIGTLTPIDLERAAGMAGPDIPHEPRLAHPVGS